MNTLIALLCVGGVALPAYTAYSIWRNDSGEHRPGHTAISVSPWVILAGIERETTGYVMTSAPTIMERGGYTPRHSPRWVADSGETPVVIRPLELAAGTKFTHNPPLAICS